MPPTRHGSQTLEIRTLATADFYLPEEVSRLRELAYNLWWCWTPEARMLFSRIQPEAWARHRNPIEVLLLHEAADWEKLLLSEDFHAAYDRVMRAFDRYMHSSEESWFRQTYPDYDGGVTAYLSTEFGLHESLGIYSGGLGILSGDHCKAASDLGLPFIAAGLLYRRGYFRQTIDAEGRQQHTYPDFDLTSLAALPVLDRYGRPLVVSVPLLDRRVHLAVHKVQVGRVPVLLLNSDLQLNDPQDRPITHILYVRGREMRLCQEMVLGIGAVKALRALDIDPAVWHINEGHVAFMLLERLREEIDSGERFDRAREIVKQSVAFTTHTPVPAGNETFDADLCRLYLGQWAMQLDVPTQDLMAMGQAKSDDDNEAFNMTVMALRMAAFRNGVSAKHGEVSREMWKGLFPEEDTPIESITNGVHLPTWVGLEMREVFHHAVGWDWTDAVHDFDRWKAIDDNLTDAELWEAHCAQKRRLVRNSRKVLRRMLARHGESPRVLESVNHMLDPEILTVGFARRFATYKRAGLLFRDMDRLERILGSEDRPVQFIFAGKAHPADLEGQALIEEIFRLSRKNGIRGRIVFLEDYNMHIGRLMVQGVDVWMNNPKRPLEASGTSGQKAGVNGALNLSVLDGWWIEAYGEDLGWAIGGTEPEEDENKEIDEDAASLYDLLENSVAPLFYDRDEHGLPLEWIRRMKKSIREIAPRFSGARMVREYIERAYMPLSRVAADIDHR